MMKWNAKKEKSPIRRLVQKPDKTPLVDRALNLLFKKKKEKEEKQPATSKVRSAMPLWVFSKR